MGCVDQLCKPVGCPRPRVGRYPPVRMLDRDDITESAKQLVLQPMATSQGFRDINHWVSAVEGLSGLP